MAKSKFILTLAILLFSVAVTSCGGGGSGSGNSTSGGTVSSSSSSVVADIEKSITKESATVTLPNVATLDFTSHAELSGATAQITAIIDENINAFVQEAAKDYRSEFTDKNTIVLRLTRQPTSAVRVIIPAENIIRSAGPNQIATIFAVINSEDEEDDVGNTLDASIQTHSNETDYTIITDLPPRFFRVDQQGKFTAVLKIGLIETEPITTSSAQRTLSTISLTSSLEAPISLNCPLATTGCIETSRFNKIRNLKGVTQGQHNGGDFQAKAPTPIYVPGGGKPIKAYTRQQFDAATGNSCNTPTPSAVCKSANRRAGVTLTLDYGHFYILLMHLEAIDASLMVNGTINNMAVTSDNSPVALTGGTGVGFTSPHLHYELFTYTDVSVCHQKGSTGKCSRKWGQVDPFPYIAKRVDLVEVSGRTTLQQGSGYSFTLAAKDSKGVAVTSQVGNAQENSGSPPTTGQPPSKYDPTRKICLRSLTNNTLQFPHPNQITTFSGINGSYCAPWGTTVTATAIASNPTTTVSAGYSKDPEKSVLDDPQHLTEATVTLTGTVPQPVKVSISANSVSIGGVSRIEWSSANASSCQAIGNHWAGALPVTGTFEKVHEQIGTYRYTVQCDGFGGSAMASADAIVFNEGCNVQGLVVECYPTSSARPKTALVRLAGAGKLLWQNTGSDDLSIVTPGQIGKDGDDVVLQLNVGTKPGTAKVTASFIQSISDYTPTVFTVTVINH